MKFEGNSIGYQHFMRQVLMNYNEVDEKVNVLDQFAIGEPK